MPTWLKVVPGRRGRVVMFLPSMIIWRQDEQRISGDAMWLIIFTAEALATLGDAAAQGQAGAEAKRNHDAHVLAMRLDGEVSRPRDPSGLVDRHRR